jgi:predicted RNase H-like nuclease (RuvC/YqgF family)
MSTRKAKRPTQWVHVRSEELAKLRKKLKDKSATARDYASEIHDLGRRLEAQERNESLIKDLKTTLDGERRAALEWSREDHAEIQRLTRMIHELRARVAELEAEARGK